MNVKAPTTAIFTISPGTYVRTVLSIWASQWWWAILIPPAAFATLGAAFNPAFCYIALMLLFLIYPGVLVIIYFNYALTPEARAEIIPHRLTFRHESISIEYFKSKTDNDGNKIFILESQSTVKASDIIDIAHTRTKTILRLQSRRIRIIIVPYTASANSLNTEIDDIIDSYIDFKKN